LQSYEYDKRLNGKKDFDEKNIGIDYDTFFGYAAKCDLHFNSDGT